MYFLLTEQQIQPHWAVIWLLPVLVALMAGLGLGAGIFISSLTTKYRDLTFLVGFGVQLLIYASSIVLPISTMSARAQEIMLMNPIVPIIETFKYIFLGKGFFSVASLAYSAVFMLVQLFIAVVVFSRVEKSFMDTV
jgi:lipopolysaccharide transport system permease protein